MSWRWLEASEGSSISLVIWAGREKELVVSAALVLWVGLLDRSEVRVDPREEVIAEAAPLLVPLSSDAVSIGLVSPNGLLSCSE